MRAPRSALGAAAGAVSFLTRLPVGRRLDLDAADVGRGAFLFPLVGAGLGALVGLIAAGLERPFTPLLAAALAVGIEIVLTGGIHVDALADAADGLGAGSRERAFEIMREGSIGAFGAGALVIDLLAKTAALTSLLDDERTVWLVLGAWATGRAAPLALAWALPYARASAGSGRVLTDHARRSGLALGLAVSVAVAIVSARSRSPALLGGAATALILVGAAARRRFGGVTGDVLGAAVEVTTTLGLVGAAATT